MSRQLHKLGFRLVYDLYIRRKGVFSRVVYSITKLRHVPSYKRLWCGIVEDCGSCKTHTIGDSELSKVRPTYYDRSIRITKQQKARVVGVKGIWVGLDFAGGE